jgi:hypothetical protein
MFRGVRFACMVLAAAVVPSVVSSAEATVFSLPGLDCAGIPAKVNYPGGLIEATQAVTVYCSMLRPAPDAGNITSISISVTDNSTSEGFACTAVSCADAASCSSSALGNTTGPQTGDATLTLSSLAGKAGGEAYIFCAVPGPGSGGARSKIHSFQWND